MPLPDLDPADSAERRLRSEWHFTHELPRLLVRLPGLLAGAPRPTGAALGAPVVVLPGYGTGDGFTWALRRYLNALGYAATGWGLGRNTGAVGPQADAALPKIQALAAERPVRLVGWSLGGVIAREIARRAPDAIDRVITMGSPVVGGPRYTAYGAAWRRRGADLDAIEAQITRRESARPVPVPLTTIYSRRDGVVWWRACVDPFNEHAEGIEVRCTHAGMGFHPEVYAVLAERLV